MIKTCSYLHAKKRPEIYQKDISTLHLISAVINLVPIFPFCQEFAGTVSTEQGAERDFCKYSLRWGWYRWFKFRIKALPCMTNFEVVSLVSTVDPDLLATLVLSVVYVIAL